MNNNETLLSGLMEKENIDKEEIHQKNATQRKRKMTVKKITKFIRNVLKTKNQNEYEMTGEPGEVKRSKVDAMCEGHSGLVMRKFAHSIPTDVCLDGLSEELRQDLAKQLCPNDCDKYGLTPVHRACEIGSIPHLQILLAVGGMVNISTAPIQGLVPAIMFAATNGHADCVKMLIDHGADVNLKDEWGNTALYKASAYNHIDCVRVLLDAGADPNVENRWGATPLQYAALQGHSQVVQQLLYSGASLDKPGEKTVPPPLIAASMRGYSQTVHTILMKNPDLTQKYGNQTALHMALEHFLLSCNGYASAMSSADSAERYQCVQMLINSGSEIHLDILDLMHSTDMIPYLVTDKYVSILRLLIQAIAYNKTDCNVSFMALFEHITRLGPYKWQLIKLLCSTGFTPSLTVLNHLAFALTNQQNESLQELVCNARPLMDLCRTAIRKNIHGGNILSSIINIPLPVIIQDYIALKQHSSYII